MSGGGVRGGEKFTLAHELVSLSLSLSSLSLRGGGEGDPRSRACFSLSLRGGRKGHPRSRAAFTRLKHDWWSSKKIRVRSLFKSLNLHIQEGSNSGIQTAFVEVTQAQIVSCLLCGEVSVRGSVRLIQTTEHPAPSD